MEQRTFHNEEQRPQLFLRGRRLSQSTKFWNWTRLPKKLESPKCVPVSFNWITFALLWGRKGRVALAERSPKPGKRARNQFRSWEEETEMLSPPQFEVVVLVSPAPKSRTGAKENVNQVPICCTARRKCRENFERAEISGYQIGKECQAQFSFVDGARLSQHESISANKAAKSNRPWKSHTRQQRLLMLLL